MSSSQVDQINIDYSDLLETTTMWAVSVPGESQWRTEELSPHVPSMLILYLLVYR